LLLVVDLDDGRKKRGQEKKKKEKRTRERADTRLGV
jgi:hypothetical protein